MKGFEVLNNMRVSMTFRIVQLHQPETSISLMRQLKTIVLISPLILILGFSQLLAESNIRTEYGLKKIEIHSKDSGEVLEFPTVPVVSMSASLFEMLGLYIFADITTTQASASDEEYGFSSFKLIGYPKQYMEGGSFNVSIMPILDIGYYNFFHCRDKNEALIGKRCLKLSTPLGYYGLGIAAGSKWKFQIDFRQSTEFKDSNPSSGVEEVNKTFFLREAGISIYRFY